MARRILDRPTSTQGLDGLRDAGAHPCTPHPSPGTVGQFSWQLRASFSVVTLSACSVCLDFPACDMTVTRSSVIIGLGSGLDLRLVKSETQH